MRYAPAPLSASGRPPATQEDLNAKRRMAQAFMQQATDASPVGHWTQALARAVQGISGGMASSQAASGAQDLAAFEEKQSAAKRMAEREAAFQDKQRWDEYQRTRPRTESESLDMQMKRAQINALNQRSAAGGASDARVQQLMSIGIDPESAEGKAYLLTGKLPAAAYQNIAQEQRKKATAPKIAEGLQNLNKMADTYNDAAFENSLGPMQGSTPDGLISGALINTARGLGEAWNAVEGGNATPNEVRNNIVGSTEALAAAIKPLIRAPGEGVWTDADQARLVAIVGDLSQARNKDEYRRRLNDVRDRIRANFGLEIPFDAVGGPTLQKRGAQPFLNQGGAAAGGFKYIGTAP